MKSAALSCGPLSTPSSIQPSIRSSIAGSPASISCSVAEPTLNTRRPIIGMISRLATSCRYRRGPKRPSPAAWLASDGSRSATGNRILRATICNSSFAQLSASSTLARCSGSAGNSGGSGWRSSRKRAIRWLVEIRSPSASSAGTVPRWSPTRSASGRPEPALRVSPPPSNPCSRTASGCSSVGTSTRRYGTCLCSSISIADRQACDPGIT